MKNGSISEKQFLRLFYELAPDEEKFYAQGTKEVEGEIKKVNDHPLKQVACPWRYTRKTRQYASETFGRSTTAHKPEDLCDLQANA